MVYDIQELKALAEEVQDFTEKDRTRFDRRKQDYAKAVSKRRKDLNRGNVSKEHPWYNNLHQYSKNKIHCSCLMCAFNGRKHGRIVFKARSHGDLKTDARMEAQLHDYNNADYDYTIKRIS